MVAYRDTLNSIINDIWNSIEWKDKRIRGKKQVRIIPFITNLMNSKSG